MSNKEKITTLQRINLLGTEERRKEIMRRRVRGDSVAQIAADLDMATSTVYKDLKIIQEENSSILALEEKRDLLGGALTHYEVLKQHAWETFQSAHSVPEKVKCLDLLRVLQGDCVKVLKDVGLLEPEPKAAEVVHTHKIDWSPEMQDRISRALIADTLSVIDEEPIPEAEIIGETEGTGDDTSGE